MEWQPLVTLMQLNLCLCEQRLCASYALYLNLHPVCNVLFSLPAFLSLSSCACVCVAPAQFCETSILVHNGRLCGLLHGIQGQRGIGESSDNHVKSHIRIGINLVCCVGMSSLHRTYIHMCAHMCVHMYVCTYVCTYVSVHICVYICKCAHL